MSGLKDAARLLAYGAATVLFGALVAPWLFWGAQALTRAGVLPWIARFDFETFFHRALLAGAILFAWPLLRSLKIQSRADLGVRPNVKWLRDFAAGFSLAAIPLFCVAAVLLITNVFGLRTSVAWRALVLVALASLTVPLIEETLFRGLLFGVLSRASGNLVAAISSAAVFSILHFLKAPPRTTLSPSWSSGFVSIANAFLQFRDPMLVLGGFTTLFLIGCVLAHARILTNSLWLPIGLHAGWIFASGEFNKLTQRQVVVLPWLGKSLLVGVVPLALALFTWAFAVLVFRHDRARRS